MELLALRDWTRLQKRVRPAGPDETAMPKDNGLDQGQLQETLSRQPLGTDLAWRVDG